MRGVEIVKYCWTDLFLPLALLRMAFLLYTQPASMLLFVLCIMSGPMNFHLGGWLVLYERTVLPDLVLVNLFEIMVEMCTFALAEGGVSQG